MNSAHPSNMLNQPNHNSRTFANAHQRGNIPLHLLLHYRLRLLLAAALFTAFLTAGSSPAFAQFVGPTPLTLINGWTNAPFSTSLATVEEVAGIVQFRGAIATSGSNPFPFTLPAGLAPATDVYIPVDLCNATKGRLHITPGGIVDVEVETLFSNAQCFTSLDGASYATNATGFTALTLINGWTNAPFATSNAALKLINGVVHFKGAISSGTNALPFVLPAAFRPSTDVYIPVDLCDATNGRLHIQKTGTVDIEEENGNFANAQCFTSLDGAWFVKAPAAFKALTLINGWVNAPFTTSNAMAGNAYGLVYLKGAISSGTTAQPFVLPVAFRPVTDVYVPVDLCNATNGRLFIHTDGRVTINVENGVFSNAQCFTSLDGVSFVQ
jgi:hypothetical protein